MIGIAAKPLNPRPPPPPPLPPSATCRVGCTVVVSVAAPFALDGVPPVELVDGTLVFTLPLAIGAFGTTGVEPAVAGVAACGVAVVPAFGALPR